ncbi:MAG: hypothetical protein U1F71_23690 [Verrucomicrobiaceae bacterium]
MTKPSSRNRQSARPSLKFSRSDKLKIFGFIFLFFVAPTLFWHFYSIHHQEASVTKTVEEWKSIYHLDDSQAARIKQIELDFHSSGSPFDFKAPSTKDEKRRHHEQISSLMPPEDGVRFMQVMEQNAGRH